MYYDDWKYEKFYPHGKLFCLELGKYGCSKLYCGECYVNKSYVNNLKSYNGFIEKYDKDYCPRIMKRIIENGYQKELEPITIYKYGCGHYDTDGGRHRICAAAKLNVPIYVRIKKYKNDVCRACLVQKGMRGWFKKLRYKHNYKDTYIEEL